MTVTARQPRMSVNLRTKNVHHTNFVLSEFIPVIGW